MPRYEDVSLWVALISAASTVIMLIRTFGNDTRESAKREQKLDSIGSNVESLLKKVENYGNRITVLETKYDQLRTDLNELRGKFHE